MWEFPTHLLYIPLDKWIDSFTEWLITEGDIIFGLISDVLFVILLYAERFMLWIPWIAVIVLAVYIGWHLAGARLAVGVGAGLLFIGAIGLWTQAMQTMSLVLVATLLAVVCGIPIGIAMSKSDVLESIIKPILDLMQTMPIFVYLIPALMLFGLGRVPALFATWVFAIPPVIRFTNLGIRQVSANVVEAAEAFGSTGSQILFWIQIPLALPTIMAGVNQTIMMAVSMVVLASMVGAEGVGASILRGITRLEVGTGFVGGITIVILAIIIDRLTASLGNIRVEASDHE